MKIYPPIIDPKTGTEVAFSEVAGLRRCQLGGWAGSFFLWFYKTDRSIFGFSGYMAMETVASVRVSETKKGTRSFN